MLPRTQQARLVPPGQEPSQEHGHALPATRCCHLQVGKPLLKLTDDDYNEGSLQVGHTHMQERAAPGCGVALLQAVDPCLRSTKATLCPAGC